MTKFRVTTIDYNDAFPTLPRDSREFGVKTDQWEFVVEEVPSRQRQEPIGVKVRMFDDAWKAYAEIPEFFSGLAHLATVHSGVTLAQVKALCRDLGYHDLTVEYAARHEHQYRCACGVHHPDEVSTS